MELFRGDGEWMGCGEVPAALENVVFRWGRGDGRPSRRRFERKQGLKLLAVEAASHAVLQAYCSDYPAAFAMWAWVALCDWR